MTEETAPKPGLKKVAQGEGWTSSPAVLYLDDIETIYGLFRQVSDKVTLRLDGYELDSPAAAAQLTATDTKDLEISSANPYATFRVIVYTFWFYVSDRENLVLLGLRDATKEVLQRRRLWAPELRVVVPLFWLFIVASWLTWFVPKGPWLLLSTLVSFVGMVVFGGASLIAYRTRFHRSGRVILRDSGSKQSFRHANRDLLLVLVSIIGTFVTTVLGGVVVYLILLRLGLVGRP